ncbi:MAG: hypothetical protein EXQ81_10785 [Thermoleophilia bacterium]|nr:hypothetical protein [Thermoleophilia bacterium]
MNRHAGGRATLVVAVVLLVGCGGKGSNADPATPCSDASFRAQDEELYVARATVSNAIGGGGAADTVLLDLRRGRDILAEYVEEHPPCDGALKLIATREEGAVAVIDEAVAALEEGSDAVPSLARALEELDSVQKSLMGSY